MKCVYDERSIRLFDGDALELPEWLGGDLFLTDPPYARAGGIHNGRRNGEQVEAAGADQFWLFWFKDVCKRLLKTMKPEGCGFIFCDYKTVSLVERAIASTGSGWAMTQCLVWDRECFGMGTPFRAAHELVAFCRGPEFQWGGRKNMSNVLRFRWPYGRHEHHPAEKPVALMQSLIEETTQPGALVVDPFTGSGPVLVAAQASGRQAIGVELDPEHRKTTMARLAQGSLSVAS